MNTKSIINIANIDEKKEQISPKIMASRRYQDIHRERVRRAALTYYRANKDKINEKRREKYRRENAAILNN